MIWYNKRDENDSTPLEKEKKMIRIYEIKISIKDSVASLTEQVAAILGVPKKEIKKVTIVRESIDARKKSDIKKVYTIDVALNNEVASVKKSRKNKYKIEEVKETKYELPGKKGNYSGPRPVVVGFGPSGMMAALMLSEMGYNPLVIEQGKTIEDRAEDVRAFWKTGVLNPMSNVQFGEGGAGSFSDGKLYTGITNLRIKKVFETFVACGAPRDILYKQKPHIGTDILRGMVKNIRKKIESLGGEFRFSTKLVNFDVEDDRLKTITVESEGVQEVIKTEVVLLGIGHSARDTFQLLYEKGVAIEPKPFSMGVRIEHKQSLINACQYGDEKNAAFLGPAEYKLSYKASDGRGVYSFCMCPGGLVVGAASEPKSLVVNGMSYRKRAEENANSGILVSVTPKDFGSEHPLAGIEFQRKWEKIAYQIGGGGYKAPAQSVGDFLKLENSKELQSEEKGVVPSYQPSVTFADLSQCLPEFVTRGLREALPRFGKKIKGFDHPENILTGIETRSSSPVRILRDEAYQANIKGLFPMGEGAGYAGGITSASVDGMIGAEYAFVFMENNLH